ncbi:MAG TPA: hypothetical protein VGQ83_31945 [Polyangia bacterium]
MRATILACLLTLTLAAPAAAQVYYADSGYRYAYINAAVMTYVPTCPGPFPGSGSGGGSGATCFDTFNFMAKAGYTYTISTTASYSGDTYVVVYGACNCTNDDYGGLGSQCTCTAAYDGPAYICASSYGSASASYNYTVTGDCAAWPQQAAPELERVYLHYNYNTGDIAPSWCDSKANYGLVSAFQVYRNSYDWRVGTPWPSHPLYMCTRWVQVQNQDGTWYWKSDEYISRDYWCNGFAYYGYPDQQVGYALDYQSEGGLNAKLLTCWYLAQVTSGGNQWWELRNEFNACTYSQYAPVSDNGWVRFQSGGGKQGDLGNTSGGTTCDAAHCMGMCGVNCDGILGTHYYTDACMAHDICVCNHNNDLLDPACYASFLLAAGSWVVQAAVSLLEAIVNFFKSIFDALCFWC